MSSEIETLLGDALHARADQVGPTDLGPGFVPPVRRPWWQRPAAYVAGGVAVAAAAAVVAVAVIGHQGVENGVDRPDLGPAASSTVSAPPSSAPTAASTGTTASTGDPSNVPTGSGAPSVPDGLLPADEPTWSLDGETVTYPDGAEAAVTGREVVIRFQGVTSRGTLPMEAEGGVAPFQLQLGQAGVGYLVMQGGGDIAQYSVVVPDGTEAKIAVTPEDVPFATESNEQDGPPSVTWTTGEGAAIYTRVQQEPGVYRYDVYRWEVTGPGEGGGATPPPVWTPTLVPTYLGATCFTADGASYAPC